MARRAVSLAENSPLRIVILGGGVSGLASANAALSACASGHVQSVTLLESSSRLGGWVNTVQYPDGCTFELGPRSIRSAGLAGRNTLELVSRLGIEQEVLPITGNHPSASKRYIYAKGQMSLLPLNLTSIFTKKPPLSHSVISALLKEPFKKKSEVADETVHEFFTRRLGKEIADYFVDAFCHGIFASGAKELSIGACFPYLVKCEQDYGSLIGGMIFSKNDEFPNESSSLFEQSRKEKWRMWTFKNGLQTLVDHWVPDLEQKGLVIKRETGCKSLQITSDNKFICETSQGQIEADHVISALSAADVSRLLPPNMEQLKMALQDIQSVSVGVVNLEFDGQVLPFDGFGFLVPSCERRNILGVIFDSCVNDQGRNNTTLTVMSGGSRFEELFGNPHDADHDYIERVALDAIKETLGIAKKPLKCLVTIQKNCIPKYRVGHMKTLADIKSCISESQLPLTLVGSSYKAAGINDCIYNAQTEVQQFINSLGI